MIRKKRIRYTRNATTEGMGVARKNFGGGIPEFEK